MTTITFTDPLLVNQIVESAGPFEVCDPAGNILSVDARFGVPPAGSVIPISLEELERRSKVQREGRPLAGILRELREKHGS